jgi:hypothetical protein
LSLVLEPQAIFQTLYRPSVSRGFREYDGPQPVNSLATLVETEFVRQTHQIISRSQSSLDWRKENILSLSHELSRVQSNQFCLYCLARPAQHSMACHHALCDLCPQLFGAPASHEEYRFSMSTCLLCHSRATLVIDVLPPTMNPTILAIDGGGVRGGIPLEYLLLIQESLGRDCRIHDLIDLSVGSSSGTFGPFLCRFDDLLERSISKIALFFFFSFWVGWCGGV